MEQEDDFINAALILRELESKLSQLSESSLAMKQSEAHREVELHFEKCLRELALRKEILLREIDAKFDEQKNKLESQQSKMKDSISACKKMMEAGVTIYKHQRSAAVYCWKGANELKYEPEKVNPIRVKFNAAISAIFESHGCICTTPELQIVPFTRAGAVTTFVGTTDGHQDGSAEKAQFNSPLGIIFNPVDSCFYVTDSSNNMIRKITLQGDVTTFAGKKKDGPFHYPAGMCFWKTGQCFFVASQNHTISKVTMSGQVSLFAGSGKEGNEDGVGANASFKHPTGVTVDQQTGTLYVTDCGNNSIRKITPEGQVLTVVPGKVQGFFDGLGPNPSQFSSPYGLSYFEKEHALIVCDYGNNRIQKLALASGKITTICEITKPACVVAASTGTFLVSAQNKIFKVSPNPTSGKYDVETLAGTNKHGNTDSTSALESTFNHPTGLALCEMNQVCFVADHLNSRIRRITLIPATNK